METIQSIVFGLTVSTILTGAFYFFWLDWRLNRPRPTHTSDCAVHNEPAYEAGPCDCVSEE